MYSFVLSSSAACFPPDLPRMVTKNHRRNCVQPSNRFHFGRGSGDKQCYFECCDSAKALGMLLLRAVCSVARFHHLTFLETELSRAKRALTHEWETEACKPMFFLFLFLFEMPLLFFCHLNQPCFMVPEDWWFLNHVHCHVQC